MLMQTRTGWSSYDSELQYEDSEYIMPQKWHRKNTSVFMIMCPLAVIGMVLFIVNIMAHKVYGINYTILCMILYEL